MMDKPAPSAGEVEDGKGAAIDLPEVCRIGNAAELHALLKSRGDGGDSLVVDLSRVTEADLTLLQLLISAERTAPAGRGLVLEGTANAAWRELLASAGRPAHGHAFWEGAA
jgi:anti-anti-sigma regulatory factor